MYTSLWERSIRSSSPCAQPSKRKEMTPPLLSASACFEGSQHDGKTSSAQDLTLHKKFAAFFFFFFSMMAKPQAWRASDGTTEPDCGTKTFARRYSLVGGCLSLSSPSQTLRPDAGGRGGGRAPSAWGASNTKYERSQSLDLEKSVSGSAWQHCWRSLPC